MLTTISLSTVAGLAFARLVPATSRRRPLALALVTVGVLADGWVLFPTVTAPTRSPSLDLAKGTVLELPLGTRDQDAAAMLRSSYYGQALVNGYSAYPPRHYRALAYGLERGNDDVLDLLSQYGVRFVRIDRSHTAAPQYEQYVGAQPGARLVRKDARAILYELTMSRTVAASPTLGEPLKIAGVSANVAGDTVERHRRVTAVSLGDRTAASWSCVLRRPGHGAAAGSRHPATRSLRNRFSTRAHSRAIGRRPMAGGLERTDRCLGAGGRAPRAARHSHGHLAGWTRRETCPASIHLERPGVQLVDRRRVRAGTGQRFEWLITHSVMSRGAIRGDRDELTSVPTRNPLTVRGRDRERSSSLPGRSRRG